MKKQIIIGLIGLLIGGKLATRRLSKIKKTNAIKLQNGSDYNEN